MLDKLIGFAVLCMIVAMTPVIGLSCFALYEELTSDRYDIRKDQWTCEKTEPTRTLIMAGKVPVWTTRDECVLYRKVHQ